jgi:hypothetical protein
LSGSTGLEPAMTTLAAGCGRTALRTPTLARRDRSDEIRAAVFWGFILVVIASPAALSTMILLHT